MFVSLNKFTCFVLQNSFLSMPQFQKSYLMKRILSWTTKENGGRALDVFVRLHSWKFISFAHLSKVFVIYQNKFVHRKEIDSTLDRLKKIERDLSVKEKQLKQRESKLKEREKNLEQQFKVVVSTEHTQSAVEYADCIIKTYAWTKTFNNELTHLCLFS